MLSTTHQVDRRCVFALSRSPDVKECFAAFLEERPARFPGKVSADMSVYFPCWPERPLG